MSRVVIIGNGHVGSHCAYSLAFAQVCDEIAMIDIDAEKNLANVFDVADAAALCSPRVRVYAGDERDLAQAQIAVVSIGCPRKPGQTRLDLLDESVRMLAPVTEMLRRGDFSGIVITITNPADVIAHLTREALGLPRERVFSTGTALDTLRLRRTVAEFFGVTADVVTAYGLGEHGDSSTAAFSQMRIGDVSLSDKIAENEQAYRARLCALGEMLSEGESTADAVRRYFLSRMHGIGMDIICGKGSTEFGIGAVLTDTVRAVLHDEHRLIHASVLLDGEYGMHGVHAGVPCIIGAQGIERIVSLPLDEWEHSALRSSCDVIAEYIARARMG